MRNFINTQAMDLAELIGLQREKYQQVRLVGILLSSIFFGFFIRKLPTKRVRQVYQLIYGCLLFYVMCIFIYTVMFLWPKKPIYVWVISFTCLLVVKIWDMYYNWLSWGSPGPALFMLLIQKYTMLAQCYSDGQVSDKEQEKLSERQQERAIQKLPSFFEYVSYLSLFNGAVPLYDYHDYDSFISQRLHYAKTPSTIIPALRLFILFLFCILIYIILWPIFSLDHMLTESFQESSMLYKVFFYHMSIFLWRYKYFTGFLLSDTVVRAMGLSYNGTDEKGNHKWDRMKAIQLSIESAYSYRQITLRWNCSIQVWLKNYVYLRLKNYPKKFRFMATFLVSLAWHGFYPGYFITFFFWMACNYIGKIQYKFLKFQAKKSKRVQLFWRVFFYWFNRFPGFFWVASFHFLSHERFLKAFSAQYWWQLWVMIIINYVIYRSTTYTQDLKKIE